MLFQKRVVKLDIYIVITVTRSLGRYLTWRGGTGEGTQGSNPGSPGGG